MQLMFLARDAAEFAASDAWEEDGSASAIDWMRFNCHMTSNTAGDLIAVGKNLERMPESDQAVLEGEIGYAHVKAMARTANAVRTKFDEAPLLEKARENSPGKFYYICNHFRHAADRKGYEAEQRWWRTAGSGSANAKTAPCCSVATSTLRAAPRS